MDGADQDGRGGNRRALLIGIEETRFLRRDPRLAESFPPLPGVEHDVRLLRTALKNSGYTVDSLYRDHDEPGRRETGRGVLIGALSDFFESCSPGDTALIYLSCHGVSLNGQDYLVPADAQPGPALPDGTRSLKTSTLLQAEPADLLADLPPEVTAVVCLDTCRTEGTVPAGITGTTWSSDAVRGVWLYGCSPGQPSYADSEGSWFGRALAEAMSPRTPPTTFAEVAEYVQTAVRKLGSGLPVAPPKVRAYIPHGSTGLAELVLCTGSEATLSWTRAIRESRLWESTFCTPAVRESVQEALDKLVRAVVDIRSGPGHHRDDPWDDPGYAVRVEHRLSELVRRAGLKPSDWLSAAETAALLSAPVVYEGVVAQALDELGSLAPDGLGRSGHGPRPEENDDDSHPAQVHSAALDVCRAHQQVRRTTDTLRERGLDNAARAADHWLRHRFVTDWDPLWECAGDYPGIEHLLELAVDAVTATAAGTGAPSATESGRRRISRLLRQVFGHLSVRPGSSPRINETDEADAWSTHPPVPGNRWRGEELALLLWTAGLLAADPRRLSSVLIDHLAAQTRIVPHDVIMALGTEFGYEDERIAEDGSNGAYGLAVHFPCPHPALHSAVEELAATADATVRALCARWPAGALPPLLRGMPRRVTTGSLYPQDGRYTKPIERFRLAEDEIRPLLMGTQLYGDPNLAIREMYQNALDACRYREMRMRYGAQRTGRHGDWPAGRIAFRQGWDEEGRPYIECEDNGVGMTREKLVSMFARAGHRYEQDPDFVQERRNWRRYRIDDIALNSRFGIGAFSYFMLADEVVVWTHPVDQYGIRREWQPLRADIQSGSGLLQIRSDDGDAPQGGGTRVRLYLGARDSELPSLVETLESLLWVSDYHVTAAEQDREQPSRSARNAEWKPGMLQSPKQWPGGPVQAGEDAWFVQGRGQLLLDGVLVRAAEPTWGYVFNLRERHRPEPSVDRNRLLSYDEEQVQRALLRHSGATAAWPEVDLRWLWALTEEFPVLAVAVLAAVLPHAVGLLEPARDDRFPCRTSAPLRVLGCLKADHDFLRWSASPMEGSRYWLFERWRKTLLHIRPLHDERFAPDGYPDPAPLDVFLNWPDSFVRTWELALRMASHAECSLGETTRALRRYAVAGVHVPAVEDIRALRDFRPDRLTAELYQLYATVARDRESPDSPPSALHAPLLQAAVSTGVPLGTAVKALRSLLPLDAELPEPPELGESLAQERFTPAETDFLFGFGLGNLHGPLATGSLPPLFLLRPSASLSPEHGMRRIRQLAPLGFALASEPDLKDVPSEALAVRNLVLLSKDADGVPPWIHGDAGMAHLLRVSARRQICLAEVSADINRLSAFTGVTAPTPPEAVAEWIVPDWLACLVHCRSFPLTAWELLAVLWREAGQVPSSARREAVGRLRLCGIITEETLRALERSPWLDQCSSPALNTVFAPLRHLPIVHWPDAAWDRSGMSPAYLLVLTAEFEERIGSVLRRVEEYAEHLPFTLPTLPTEALELRPTESDAHTLIGDADGSRGFRDSLTIRLLLEHALRERVRLGPCFRRLSSFTLLGAPPPPGDFTGPDAEALEDFAPDDLDLAAFGSDILGPGLLGPLELVLTAGRLGWSLGQTYGRYAPFRALGLEVTVRQPDPAEAALVPDWRDVVILTQQLTGRAPALDGEVFADHLRLCSEETDLTPAGVHERLARYAGLFTYTLPSSALELQPGGPPERMS